MAMTECRGKFFPMLYYVKQKDLGPRRFETQIHKTRDGLALAELSPLLYEARYKYGRVILNVPEETQNELRRRERLWEGTPEIASEDLVLFVTRPPLDDCEPPPVDRPVLRSNHPIEQAAFTALREV